MTTMTKPGKAAAESRPKSSKYRRAWQVVAVAAIAVFVAIGVVQSSPLPLLGLTLGLGVLGAIAWTRAPLSTPRGREQLIAGFLGAAACTLAAVGLGHHLTGGLAVVAALIATSPDVIGWVGGRS